MKKASILVITIILSFLGCGKDEKVSTIQNVELVRHEEVSFTGTLVRHLAIGCESTGYGLEMPIGTVVEIDLAANGLEHFFVEGRGVSLKGYFHDVAGVEIPSRKVLVVTEITASRE